MAKTKEQKKEILKNLTEKIKNSKSILFAKFNNLKVKDNEKLRKQLKAENSEYYVAKKTLLNLSLKNNNINDFDVTKLDGRIATVFGYEDEVIPAKILADFKKDYDGEISFLGGILDNKILSVEEVESLSKLPSKNELYAKMCSSLNSPISGFVNVLSGNMRSLLNVLKAIEEQKQ